MKTKPDQFFEFFFGDAFIAVFGFGEDRADDAGICCFKDVQVHIEVTGILDRAAVQRIFLKSYLPEQNVEKTQKL